VVRLVFLGLVLTAFAAASLAGEPGASPVATDASAELGDREGAPPDTLRVMSFNVRYGTAADGANAWEARRDLVASTIESFDPDVLGLQECLGFQAEHIADAMPGHGVVGVGRDDGADAGEMCAILYREDRFELLDAGHFWLSLTPDVVASVSWDSALTRMATWVRLRVLSAPARDLFVLNTHFDHVGVQARLQSARLVRERVAALAGASHVVVLGDFNAPADAQIEGPYAVLTGADGSAERPTARSPLVDTFRAAHPDAVGDEGTFHGFRGVSTGARIDWILASRTLAVVGAAIDRTNADGRYPSDHYPVTAVLRSRERAPRRSDED